MTPPRRRSSDASGAQTHRGGHTPMHRLSGSGMADPVPASRPTSIPSIPTLVPPLRRSSGDIARDPTGSEQGVLGSTSRATVPSESTAGPSMARKVPQLNMASIASMQLPGGRPQGSRAIPAAPEAGSERPSSGGSARSVTSSSSSSYLSSDEARARGAQASGAAGHEAGAKSRIPRLRLDMPQMQAAPVPRIQLAEGGAALHPQTHTFRSVQIARQNGQCSGSWDLLVFAMLTWIMRGCT